MSAVDVALGRLRDRLDAISPERASFFVAVADVREVVDELEKFKGIERATTAKESRQRLEDERRQRKLFGGPRA